MELDLNVVTIVLKLPPKNSAMLLFLIALTVGSYYYMRRFRKDRTTKLGNYETLKEVHGHKSFGSPVVLGVKIVIVTLLFLTATNSITVKSVQPVTDTDYAVILDTSPSMLTPDYGENRLEYSKAEIMRWSDELPGKARTVLIEASGTSEKVATLTRDKKRFRTSLEDLNASLQDPGTDLSASIRLATSSLRNTDKDRRAVMVTDGGNLDREELLSAANEASEANLKLYILGLSSNSETQRLYDELNRSSFNRSGEDISTEPIDHDTLSTVADRTGGNYYSVNSQQIFEASMQDVFVDSEKLGVNSDAVVLIFISLLVITEMWVYSRFGAI